MNTLYKRIILTGLILLTATPVLAEVGFGADAVTRYVWRGVDFGDGFSIQPGLAYTKEMSENSSLEIGAWASWGMTSNGANENDLYITYSTGAVSVTVTDYFFPPSRAGVTGDFFNYSDEDGIHVIEPMISFSQGAISAFAAINILGDDDNSAYAELSYEVEVEGDVGVTLSVGGGTEGYTTDGDPMLTNIAITASKGDYWAQYILNPDTEITFLVWGKSF